MKENIIKQLNQVLNYLGSIRNTDIDLVENSVIGDKLYLSIIKLKGEISYEQYEKEIIKNDKYYKEQRGKNINLIYDRQKF